MINYCPECGIKTNNEAQVCESCGTHLVNREEIIQLMTIIKSQTKPLNDTISTDTLERYWNTLFHLIEELK